MLSDSDRILAGVALKKRAAGEKLTRQESAALKKAERLQEEKRRWEYYETVPKKHYAQMSGRQQKVLNEQAVRYGLPIGNATISIPEVLRTFHDLLATLAKRGISLNDSTPAHSKERLEEELLRIKIQERRRELIDVSELQDLFANTTRTLRESLDRLQRDCGQGAYDIMFDAITRLQEDFERGLTGDSSD